MSIAIEQTPQGVKLGDVEFVWAKNAKEFFFSNSIVIHEEQSLVVDPSANFSYLEKLASQKKVHSVLNTHYHIDHRSLNHLFQDAIFMCHELDKPAILSFDNYLKHADQNQDSSYILWLKGIFSTLEIEHNKIHKTLKEGDLLPVKSTPVRVLHIPGHTPGHIALQFEELNTLYISDIDLTPMGPWYANISSNIDQFLNSIARIRTMKLDYYISSHGERVYDAEKFIEKLDRFEQAFYKRDELIFDALSSGPKSIEELSSIGIIYKSSSLQDPLKACFERQMIEKHLERFIEKQKIEKLDGRFWIKE